MNLQIGGLVTSGINNSFLENVSPPSSSGSFEMNGYMENSLITSGDFTNVSSFINCNNDVYDECNFGPNIQAQTESALAAERDHLFMKQFSLDNHEWDELNLDNITLVQSFRDSPPLSLTNTMQYKPIEPTNPKNKTFEKHTQKDAFDLTQTKNSTFNKNIQEIEPNLTETYGVNSTFEINTSINVDAAARNTKPDNNRTTPVNQDKSAKRQTFNRTSLSPINQSFVLVSNRRVTGNEHSETFEFVKDDCSFIKPVVGAVKSEDPINQSTPVHKPCATMCYTESIGDISPIVENCAPVCGGNDLAKRFSQIIIDNKDLEDLAKQQMSTDKLMSYAEDGTKYCRDSASERLSLKTFEDFEKSMSALADVEPIIVASTDGLASLPPSPTLDADEQEFDKIMNDMDYHKYHEYEDKMRMSLDNIKKKHSLLQDSSERLANSDHSAQSNVDSNKLCDSTDKLSIMASSNERLLGRRSRVFDNASPEIDCLLSNDMHNGKAIHRLNDTVNAREKINNRRSLYTVNSLLPIPPADECTTSSAEIMPTHVSVDSNKLNESTEKTYRRLHRRNQLQSTGGLQPCHINSPDHQQKDNHDEYNPRDRYKTISLSRPLIQQKQDPIDIAKPETETEAILPEYVTGDDVACFAVQNTNLPIEQMSPYRKQQSSDMTLTQPAQVLSKLAIGKSSRLHTMNENLRSKLSMKTSSMDSLNTRFGANETKYVRQSLLNVAQPHKSSSSGNIILPNGNKYSSREKIFEVSTHVYTHKYVSNKKRAAQKLGVCCTAYLGCLGLIFFIIAQTCAFFFNSTKI